jgi:hypothetical protein
MSEHHKKKHRVRTHRWVDGTLRYADAEFESLEEALLAAGDCEDSTLVKVYSEDGELVHEASNPTAPSDPNTYA